ncbi:unnamed protein product [Callosobruchus maculatus]|uniref:Uncharacterized protein n=1 Tax=Callosobruchus maculatus TaxID=64391 RepID=A0A653DG39_CALMS|nr:unnamed protein product [Callosobruchus maculatus]
MWSVVIILIVLSTLHITFATQCRNENDEPVDWFYAYKLPTIKHHSSNILLKNGVAYAFMTSEDHSDWRFSNVSINSTDSIIGKTLKGLYETENELFYVLYNDQPPQRRSSEDKGHNKGVILAENQVGFWLIHSVPHFPDIQDKAYTFPRTGTVFGQSFLCITLDLKNLDIVGIQLQYNKPYIYNTNILAALKSALPNLVAAASNKTVSNPPWFHLANISSNDGISFLSFAKSKDFNKDLYEDLVAPSLQSNLMVETWADGPGRLRSDCSKQFKVLNIKSIEINVTEALFTTTEDHSKWAVSSDNKNWICVGDINRAGCYLAVDQGIVVLRCSLTGSQTIEIE